MSTSLHAGYIIVNHAAERLLTHNSLPVHKPIVRRDARVCTGIDRVIELSYTSHEDPTVGVGKLSKITDKYSASNERLALWLDLTILIMARRAQRRGFLLLSPCESLSFLSRPRHGRSFFFRLHSCTWILFNFCHGDSYIWWIFKCVLGLVCITRGSVVTQFYHSYNSVRVWNGNIT